MYRSILVPLDGSPLAEQALPWALAVASRAGGGLELVRVHTLYAINDPHATWAPYDPKMDAHRKEAEQLYLHATAKYLNVLSRVPVSCALEDGLPADALLASAQSLNPDLIVMTTHGRGPVGRFLLGSG